jgi:hypothetical protein
MGSLGEEPCGWNPTTWPNCINVYRNARREFQENYTKIIQMENSYYTALQQMQSLPESAAKSDLIARTNQRIQEVSEARRQGIEVANQLEAKIQEWNWIPGFDTIFLNGLRGLKGLGLVPLLIPVSMPMLILISISGAIAVSSLAYIIGSLADSWRATENVEIAKHNSWGKCWDAFEKATAAGQTPPVCGAQPESQDWTTIALIGGSLFLVMMLMKK